jgi:site-specific recombinase XerD
MAGRVGFGPTTYSLGGIDVNDYLDFLRFEMGRTEGTVEVHRLYVLKLKAWLRKRNLSIERIDRKQLRDFLKTINGECGYANAIKFLRVFFRDYVGKPDLAVFKIPRRPFQIQNIPAKDDLRRFYENIQSLREKALFLIAASSGLRRSEILALTVEDLDFATRMIRPVPHNGKTKHSLLSFYNHEAESVLQAYIEKNQITTGRIFTESENPRRTGGLFRLAQRRTKLQINLSVLRKWFCSEMLRLGVPESYIDFYCGRVPGSILARHYLDYSPGRLREVYERSNLKVLS